MCLRGWRLWRGWGLRVLLIDIVGKKGCAGGGLGCRSRGARHGRVRRRWAKPLGVGWGGVLHERLVALLGLGSVRGLDL